MKFNDNGEHDGNAYNDLNDELIKTTRMMYIKIIAKIIETIQ